MANLPLAFMCKVGISDAPKKRVVEVDKTTHGWVFRVCSLPVVFAWQAEGAVRALYFWSNVGNIAPFLLRGASGRTEWHLNISPVFCCSVFWAGSHGLLFGAESGAVYALALFNPLVWIDGLLWVLFFRFLTWILIAALAFGAWWFFKNA